MPQGGEHVEKETFGFFGPINFYLIDTSTFASVYFWKCVTDLKLRYCQERIRKLIFNVHRLNVNLSKAMGTS